MRKFVWLVFMSVAGGATALYASPAARQWTTTQTGVDVVGKMSMYLPQAALPPDLRAGVVSGGVSSAVSGAMSGAPVATKPADGETKAAAGAPPAKKGPPPPPVTVATVVEADMPIMLSAAGTVEAIASVAIKPRVDGQITEVGFKEGDLVQEGQVLFRFDERLVKAQILQAEANIAKDKASLDDAETILNRKEALIAKKIVTEAATDTARAAVLSLKSSIAAGKAALDIQKTQLDYLTIKAPITGRTGALTAKLGTSVRAADPLALVTINQTKPVAAAFAMPQTELTALRRALANKASAVVNVGGSIPLKVPGTLMFVDNQVDKQTGTVVAKVTVPNADEALWPGTAVEVDLTVEVRTKVLSVPASAVLPAQQGMLAWVVDASNKVSTRVVQVERLVGQVAYIADGLKVGERVVTDGQQRLAPGGTVVVQEPKAPPAPPAAAAPAAEARPVAPEPAKTDPAKTDPAKTDQTKPAGKTPAAGRTDTKTRS
jgi:membrane fusion protein, multidrug efflux system